MSDDGGNAAPESTSEVVQVGGRTVQWELTHGAIENAYIQLINELKRAPTMQEVADKCNIHRNTVQRHCKDISLDDFRPSIKLHTGSVLLGLVKKAREGHAPEVKLFAQLIHGWVEKHSEEFIQREIREIKVTIIQGRNGRGDGEDQSRE